MSKTQIMKEHPFCHILNKAVPVMVVYAVLDGDDKTGMDMKVRSKSCKEKNCFEECIFVKGAKVKRNGLEPETLK